jgi:hypothetical protein
MINAHTLKDGRVSVQPGVRLHADPATDIVPGELGETLHLSDVYGGAHDLLGA